MKFSDNIPTLEPKSFNKKMIKTSGEGWKTENVNHFLIHELSRDDYELKLPFLPHRKTVNDFILLTKGEVTRSVFLDEYQVHENSVFMVKSGQIRTTEAVSNNVEGYYCHFSNEFLAYNHPFFQETNFSEPADFLQSPHLPINNKEQLEAITTLLKRIVAIYNSSTRYNLIRAYLITVLEEFRSLSVQQLKTKHTAANQLTVRFKKLLAKTVNKKHSIKHYADMLNVTPNHLNKSVRLITGKTASGLINEMIILEAKVSLIHSHSSISEVAYNLGFEDPSYFGRFFKKHSGVKPSEFGDLIDLSE